MKFIVDSMMGSIARWLRILGYDTVYDKNAEDWQILRRAELDRRTIVTRDKSLHNRAIRYGLRSILIWEEDDIPSRLAYIAWVTGIRLSVNFNETRCPEDNAPLVKVDKEKIKNKVPEPVYRLHNDFWECPRCGKVYWVGSHWKLIEKSLSEARIKLEELKRKYNIDN